MTTPEEDEDEDEDELPATTAGTLLPLPFCQSNIDMLKSVAIYVLGRKTTVITASAFIAELSLVAEKAMLAANRLSSWAILLLSFRATSAGKLITTRGVLWSFTHDVNLG